MATQALIDADLRSVPLLRTKLYIPPLRREQVRRPRLVERLDAGLDRTLTLVSAPAGFGKTTALSEWIHRSDTPAGNGRTPSLRVAWLSLDEADNDLSRFLVYLLAALQTVHADLGKGASAALQSPQPPPVEVTLTALINELSAFPDRLVLVLDDYHLIDSACEASMPIHDALTFLLRHLPPPSVGGLHLVVSTREDPPLPLARLRARGQLTELRATDLRFTSSEAASFLNSAMGLDLSAQDAAALERRTEGWIAGLQLAALSMQGRKDVSGFIQSFTGSHHFVLDYLVEEVLERQSDRVQEFLLKTAILHRLTGPLCDVLTGQDDGQEILETLQHANLFIVPLDEELRWYRYHHLFAELLRQRLQRERGDLVPELHRRASEWYRANGLISEAIHHALAASDFEQASALIVQTAWAMLMRGQVSSLLEWLHALPDAEVFSRSELALLRAWLLGLSGQLDDAEACLSRIAVPYGQGEMAAIRGYIAHHRLETGEAIARCTEALEFLPKEQWFPRGASAVILGTALLRRGDPVAASRALSQAVAIGQEAGQTYLMVVAMTGLGEAQEMQGHLDQATQTYRRALQLASEFSSEPMPFAGMPYVGLAGPLYEGNDLEGAMDCVTQGIELSKQARNADTIADGYLNLALLHHAQDHPEQAIEAIREVEAWAQRGGDSYWMARACAFRSLWSLRGADLAAASQWAEESRSHARDEGADFVHECAEIAAARVLVAKALSREATQTGEASQALRALEALRQAGEAAARMGGACKILALQALAFHAHGDIDQAFAVLERALGRAEPEGFVRAFVDEGPPMARLLYEAISRGIASDYAGQLLAAFPDLVQVPAPQAPRPASSSPLVEPLSDREREILECLAEGLTNREISSRLYLSLNTVKAHTRNIYGKLDVHSRTQAVARARALGILSST